MMPVTLLFPSLASSLSHITSPSPPPLPHLNVSSPVSLPMTTNSLTALATDTSIALPPLKRGGEPRVREPDLVVNESPCGGYK